MSEAFSVEQLEAELRRMFEERRQKNPSFSRRTFARSLGVNASTLQKILKGERQLGRLVAEKIAERLDLTLAAPSKKSRSGLRSASLKINSAVWAVLLLSLPNLNLSMTEVEKFCIEVLKLSHDQVAQVRERLAEWAKTPELIKQQLRIYSQEVVVEAESFLNLLEIYAQKKA